VRYSTWKGACLYLEDLIVTKQHRGKGIGKQLLSYTIEFAQQNGYQRLQWQVLDWNTPAIDFYKQFNAVIDDEWLNVYIPLN
jgi:GNAT superfamily N-acetyltransferase